VAVIAAAGVAIYASLEADRLSYLVLALGLASTLVLVGGLATSGPLAVPVSLAGLAATWSIAASTRGPDAPGGTILAGVGIYAVAELAYWSLEQVSVRDEPELVARRAAGLAVRMVAALVLGALLLAGLTLHASGGLVLEAVGVSAAVGLFALVVMLARAGHRAHER
jgi:hypothetical protein